MPRITNRVLTSAGQNLPQSKQDNVRSNIGAMKKLDEGTVGELVVVAQNGEVKRVEGKTADSIPPAIPATGDEMVMCAKNGTSVWWTLELVDDPNEPVEP